MSREGPKLGEPADFGMGRDAIHVAVVPVRVLEDMSPGQKVRIGGSYNEETQRSVCVWATDSGHVGVIDPYLTGPVKKGDIVWLLLNPGSATGLRHVYSHPELDYSAVPERYERRLMSKDMTSDREALEHAFREDPYDAVTRMALLDYYNENRLDDLANRLSLWTEDRQRAEDRIRAMAKIMETTYERLMDAGTRYVESEDDYYRHTRDDTEAYKAESLDWAQFWKDYALLTDQPVPEGWNGKPFEEAPYTCSC